MRRPDPIARTLAELERLLVLAKELGRANLAKLAFSKADWRVAVAAFDAPHGDGEYPSRRAEQVLHSTRNVARRLGAAGEARFASFEVGRDPNSSAAGKRFHADLAKAHAAQARLRKLHESGR